MNVDPTELVSIKKVPNGQVKVVFRTEFHLIKEDDSISDFPGFERLFDLAISGIDKLLGLGNKEDNPCADEVTDYVMETATRRNSWGKIVWLETMIYNQEDLPTYLRHCLGGK